MSLTNVVPRRKSRDPPTLFRIVLVGDDWLKKNMVGNSLLGKDVFEKSISSSPERNHNTGFSGYVEGRYITIANTADLFSPDNSDDDLKQKVKECASLCAPGPHALVLVVNPKDFDEKKRQRMELIVKSFSEQAFQHSVVFLYKNDLKSQNVIKLIERCQQRVFQWHRYSSLYQNSERQRAAFQSIEDIVSENKYCYITCNKDACDPGDTHLRQLDKNTRQAISAFSQRTDRVESPGHTSATRLNLVLCGSSAAAKASAADLILGEKTQPSPQPSSVCVKREAEVCGRHVTLVLLPALGKMQLSEEALLQEMQNCLSLCDLRVHAFLLVIHQSQHTDEDKQEVRRFKHLFGEVGVYCQTVQGMSAREFQQSTEREYEGGVAQDVVEISQWSHHTLSQRSDVLPLLEKIERMRGGVRGCYTSDFQITAQLRSYYSQLENMKMKIQALKIENDKLKGFKQGTTGDLRIVLLGKTGSGKSASGNTILGDDVFKQEFSFESVTTNCQKKTAMVNGRLTTVIDTPGLFDTSRDNSVIEKEIIRCIAMAAPGPHVLLLIIQLGRLTEEEKKAIKIVQEMFGKKSRKYMLVLFTKGDDLQGQTLEKYINKNSDMKKLLKECGNRYHVFNNRDRKQKDQVSELMNKIDSLVKLNGGKYYTNDILQDTEEVLKQGQERILEEREDQIKREKEELQAKHEEEMQKLQKEMEEERRSQEEKTRRREEEMKYKMQDIEKAIEQKKIQKCLELEEKHKAQKQKEDEIKQQIAELQFAHMRQVKQLKRKLGAEQRRREKEEEQRKLKEMETKRLWDEKLKQGIEKLSSESERSALLEQHRQDKERYEREKQEEKQRREAEDAQRREQEENEIKQMELKYQTEIKTKEKEMWDLQEWLQLQLQGVERESSERDAQQRAEMEAELSVLRQLVEKQKQKEAESSENREYDMKWKREQYMREKEHLKREAELAARMQAENDFTEEMNRRVEEAYREGHKKGFLEGIREALGKQKEKVKKMYLKKFVKQ